MKIELLIASISFAAGASMTALVPVLVSPSPRLGNPSRVSDQDAPTTVIETATYGEPAARDSSAAERWVDVELTGHKDQWEIHYPGRDDLPGTPSPDRGPNQSAG